MTPDKLPKNSVIHIPTKEEYQRLKNLLYKKEFLACSLRLDKAMGFVWTNPDMCVRPISGTQGSKGYYVKKGFKIYSSAEIVEDIEYDIY